MNIFENIKYDKVNKLLIDTNKDINSLDKKINKISDYLKIILRVLFLFLLIILKNQFYFIMRF